MNVKLIDRELVLAIHDRHLAEHGGAPGARDEALTCEMYIELNGGKPEAHVMPTCFRWSLRSPTAVCRRRNRGDGFAPIFA